MARLLVVFLCGALALPAFGQNTPDLAKILSFEVEHPNGYPGGWGGARTEVFVDDQVVHGGHWSVRLDRGADAPGDFTTITKSLPMDFAGTVLTMRGFIRTEGVTGYAGLWIREDGEAGSVAFDNMQQRQLKGTTEWQQYTIHLPVQAAGRQLMYGFLMSGTGKAWVDDIELLVDGKPIWEAPKVARVTTVLDTDHEFDRGSGISLTELSSQQVQNLAVLGKVWGFLKYHHPQVVSGQRHWDYDLLRVMPKIMRAPDRAAANKVLLDWIAALGQVTPCQRCTRLDEKDLALRPDIGWLADEKTLGGELSKSLLAVYAARGDGKQFYVSRSGVAPNPAFDHELGYTQVKMPDPGFQLLALYRFWNIVQYWSPNRDIVGENWDDVLTAFVPRVALAKSNGDYARQLMALVAMDHDTHANLWNALAYRPPEGVCQLPVTARFVENRAVIAGYSAEGGKSSGLKLGDVITKLDGVPVTKLIADWSPYYADSNDAARYRDLGRSLTRGACGEVRVGVEREAGEQEVKTPRIATGELDANAGFTHDRPGDTFQLLSKDVAYLKLSSVKIADVDHYVEAAAGTKGMILDIRNYPSEFMVFALGQRLVDKPTQFVRFTQCDLANPGALYWKEGPMLQPVTPHYAGKIVVLVDEVSQSQAEYTTMAFRSAPRTTVIGSMTAGADGDVSSFSLPGGLTSMISGLGIFYPDKKPTQRVGIVPDIEVKPTIAGIRAGRDELLEAAIKLIDDQRDKIDVASGKK